MSDWIDVCSVDELQSGCSVVADLDGTAVAVFNVDGEFYAIEDMCTHDGAEIASGKLEGGEIVCPRHGARFCVRTGQVRKAPAYEDVATFPVRIANGQVQVRDARWD